MTINIETLQQVISDLLSRIKETKGSEIELKNDFYWEISANELYDPYKEPTKFLLGQLTDDWQEIRRLLDSDNEVVYDLKRVANILTAINTEYSVAF